MNTILTLLLFSALPPTVQIELPPQSHVPNCKYEAHACVPLPPGWPKDTKDYTLVEDGQTIQCQPQVRSKWPDGSPKWLHVYAPWKYRDGKPAQYMLMGMAPRVKFPATGRKPGTQLTPYCTDHLGRTYKPGPGEWKLLESGPICEVWYVTGDMVSMYDARVLPFLKYEMWVSCYDNRTDVLFAFTVLGECRRTRIADLGVRCGQGNAIFLRDEGRRLPHQVTKDGVALWPLGGLPRVAVTKENLHTYPWMHSGEFLSFHAPDEAYDLARKLQAESELPYKGNLKAHQNSASEWSEARATDLLTSGPDGLSIVCEFSLVKLDDHIADSGKLVDGWRKLLQMKPVAKPSPQWICDSGALGPIAPRSTKHEQFEQSIDRAFVSFHDSGKLGAVGWANFGNVPERMINGRPSQHRACSTWHYWLHPVWLQVFRGAGQPVLDAARQATAYQCAFGQCRHVDLRSDGLPVTRGKLLWGYYHSHNFYPWGANDYGTQDFSGVAQYTGHWVDPTAQQYAWLHDGNWMAKSGYDGWLSAVDFGKALDTAIASGTLDRDIIVAFSQCVHAARYTGDKRLYEQAKRMAAALIAVPLLANKGTGALAYPTWPLMADEVLQSPASKQFILDSAKALAGTKTPWIYDVSTVAVMAEAVRLGADSKILDKVFPPRPIEREGTLELGPGPMGEREEAVAWPHALRALPSLN